MASTTCWLVLAICVMSSSVWCQTDDDSLKKQLETIENVLQTLGRQLMLQQLYITEGARSTGDSGIKSVRLHHVGSRPYHSETHAEKNKIMAIHAHSNNIRTVGMGEFTAVLNGVEFRTRHNDYGLRMPSTTSDEYHAVEDVPFPDVPPSVKELENLADQIMEMREYFKAWKTQDFNHRDYRPYFKPLVCYLEGAWTTKTDTLEESFESDRHFIDASSWQDLQDKIRFTSYTGTKDGRENLAYLPTTIMDFINDTIPVLAQWNYRILCSPLSGDLPLNRLRVVDDVATRMTSMANIHEFSWGRAARFVLNPRDQDEWEKSTSFPTWQLLDKIMYQVPGKDNYAANLTDTLMGRTAYMVDSDEKLNTGYYHRVFRASGKKDAMGISTRRRGYNDRSVFMAATTQPRVAGMKNKCSPFSIRRGRCAETYQRFTYAIPLEIIYLTPLTGWNPYGIEYKGKYKTELANTVSAGGRNGKKAEKAYNGTHSKLYYVTPAEFFQGGELDIDAADTVKGAAWFLGADGEAHQTMSSGTRIHLPVIPDVGRLRLRYPIMPVYGEGETVFKNLETIIDLLMEPKQYPFMYRGSYDINNPRGSAFTLRLGMSDTDVNKGLTAHEHWVSLTEGDLERLSSGETVTVTSTFENGHQHVLEIDEGRKTDTGTAYNIKRCGDKKTCPDGHPSRLILDNLHEQSVNDVSDTSNQTSTIA